MCLTPFQVAAGLLLLCVSCCSTVSLLLHMALRPWTARGGSGLVGERCVKGLQANTCTVVCPMYARGMIGTTILSPQTTDTLCSSRRHGSGVKLTVATRE